MKRLYLLWVALLLIGCDDRVRVGEIEFFGYKGMDVDAVRAALPIHEGEEVRNSSDEWKRKIAGKVKQTIGREPTDVDSVCCDSTLRWMIYIGLPGESSQPLAFNPAPSGAVRFPAEVVKLSEAAGNALMQVVMREGHAAEDDSKGYMLSNDPVARNKQLEILEYAQAHEPLILQVLATSPDAAHRTIAAGFLAYAGQSDEQLDAFVKACLDPYAPVRNNATRALAVLLSAKPELTRRISMEPFIRLLKSGTWTDNNKASLLLVALTNSRDPAALQQLRAEALDTLIEMARWRTDHGRVGRLLLGRIAGIEEAKLAQDLPLEAILAALTPGR
jgi:hypothetical protein